MKQVTVYTTLNCPYCIRAKELLSHLEIPYKEIDLTHNPEEREKVINTYNWHTVPAICIEDEFIGGFDDLNQLHQSGELMKKITA